MVQLGILVTQQYRLLSLAAVLDVFETVNSIYSQEGKDNPFQIIFFSTEKMKPKLRGLLEGHPVHVIGDGPKLDLIFIPAFNTHLLGQAIADNEAFIPWLKNQYKNGAEIASYCTGAFLLAATGLLDGRIATTHIDTCPAFSAIFPNVHLTPDRVVTGDGGLYTSGGATSGFHLMLYLIQRHCDRQTAVKIAKLFAIDMDRDQQTYFGTFLPGKDHHDDLVALTQEKIAASYHDAATLEDIVRDIPASRRNIARRFKLVTGLTPIEYLQKTRIEAAKKLLEQTNQQMTEIMLNCGYNDPKAFRKIFRKTVGMTPTSYREKFQLGYA